VAGETVQGDTALGGGRQDGGLRRTIGQRHHDVRAG
jgi:hypothetical protein